MIIVDQGRMSISASVYFLMVSKCPASLSDQDPGYNFTLVTEDSM